MARVLRGEIYWADLDPTRGHEQSRLRPVVVLSRALFNERSGTVIAAAITSRPQRVGFPFSLEVQGTRMPQRSWVKISQFRTLSTERLGERIGRLPAAELRRIVAGLLEIIGEA